MSGANEEVETQAKTTTEDQAKRATPNVILKAVVKMPTSEHIEVGCVNIAGDLLETYTFEGNATLLDLGSFIVRSKFVKDKCQENYMKLSDTKFFSEGTQAQGRNRLADYVLCENLTVKLEEPLSFRWRGGKPQSQYEYTLGVATGEDVSLTSGDQMQELPGPEFLKTSLCELIREKMTFEDISEIMTHTENLKMLHGMERLLTLLRGAERVPYVSWTNTKFTNTRSGIRAYADGYIISLHCLDCSLM